MAARKVAALLVLSLAVCACSQTPVPSTPSVREAESVAPPAAASIVTGTVVSTGNSATRWTFRLRWGSPESETQFLLLDSTRLTLDGVQVVGNAKRKASALESWGLGGGHAGGTVSFETSSQAPLVPSSQPLYRYPIALSLAVSVK